MARLPRPLAAGLTYHVTARGNERKPIVRDDRDRRSLLARLGTMVRQRAWSVASFCEMTNHLHVLVRTPEPDLSDGMRELLGDHARLFNERHERTGHLFQGRFHARVVTRDEHHLWIFRYLAHNPVAAGLCTTPEQYPWSAHAAHLGLVPPPPFLDTSLAPFAGDRAAYAAFVSAGPADLGALLGTGSNARLHAAQDAGFTQRQIATTLGVNQSNISRRLNASNGPDPSDAFV